MSGCHNFDRHPVVQISSHTEDCQQGWQEISSQLKQHIQKSKRYIIALECYPGVLLPTLTEMLKSAFPEATVLSVEGAYRQTATLRALFQPTLTDDRVFGFMRHWDIAEFFDERSLAELKRTVAASTSLTILVGTGTQCVEANPDLLLHAGLTRWELQQRQRSQKIGNLGFDNPEDPPSQLYKAAYFLEWRVADDIRHRLFPKVDYFLDVDQQETPRMVAGGTLRHAVRATVQRPFRVVPFFDPGPWGGQWMKQTFDLPDGTPNYAWCFDCVPEENSITLGFGSRRFQMPANVLVHEQPLALLGEFVYGRFGAEFPIRFDLLDTVGGGNLSLQVHPKTEYIRKHFGMAYTQDESYYILDCRGRSELYLGLREGIDPAHMAADLEAAQRGDIAFPAERYVNLWPTQKHDHFSIPSGTIHCSGKDNLVLEISATPYIFTFKLWDWGRVGLDGRPRPIHLEHGLANIQWNRDSTWVEKELLHQVETIAEGPGWREERTGLHSAEFLETRRTWFTDAVSHDTQGHLHVLNLVEGHAVSVESPAGNFEPLEIHYAETFIVPAAVGPYIIRPLEKTDSPLATIKAYVREAPKIMPESH
jgi:mannose-6-phosphate isomerase class I